LGTNSEFAVGYLQINGRGSGAEKPLLRLTLLAIAAVTASFVMQPEAAQAKSQKRATLELDKYVKAGVRREALEAAFRAYEARKDQVKRPYLTLIDYKLHSSKPRMFVIDLTNGKMKALHVAHGKGSDPNHTGFAQRFSNIPESKMSSLGAFITANTYHGKHGLSLRLIGLDETNNMALARAIVMHGASYVSSKLGVGRSWGCPSIETRYVKEWIPKLANGAFLYITS
jgi:hypothetical protein